MKISNFKLTMINELISALKFRSMILLLFFVSCESKAQTYIYANADKYNGQTYLKKIQIKFQNGKCSYKVENYIIVKEDTLTNEGDGRYNYFGTYKVIDDEYIVELELVDSSIPISPSEPFSLKFKIIDQGILSEKGEKFQRMNQ
jgi:hypothetical protein